MPVKVYNTLSGTKEPLEPRADRRFTMYTCGPTVYDSTHAGHLIPPIIGDVVKRYLRQQGYEVVWAHNFTDVEDKIIRRAQEQGTTPEAIAERYIAEYLEVMAGLGIETVDVYPRVSDHMPDIIAMIGSLVDKGYAYAVDGDVYFDVTRFPDYGKLSRRSPGELQAGARIQVDERKRNPGDFALWKAAKPGEPSWDSPWGPGRPGWHIECSVMSYRHLGYPVDIHGGGIDLVFPHHENEIAQSEAFAGQEPFVRYWLHNGLLKMDDEKMSKSLGNFVTARELLDRYGREVLRFYVLSHHYRSPREFNERRLEEARRARQRLQGSVDALRQRLAGATSATGLPAADGRRDGAGSGQDAAAASELEAAGRTARELFHAAMSDDFNTAEAIGALFELAHAVNGFVNGPQATGAAAQAAMRAALAVFEEADEVLGILQPHPARGDDGRLRQIVDGLVALLLEVREEARQERDWVRADRIRDRMAEIGLVVEDTPAGPRCRWS
ncbi:MAG TPA: cysteine--tRNA ligase [Bacillota bacterium]